MCSIYHICSYKWFQTTMHTRVLVNQTVLFYAIESWVVMGAMLKVLEGFHNGAAHRIAEIMAMNAEGGEWDCPTVADEMEAAGYGRSRNTSRGGRTPLRRKWPVDQAMSCKLGQNTCRGLDG